MGKIEQETEIHRTQKAVKGLLKREDATHLVHFDHSDVNIIVSPNIADTYAGQISLALMVNLLARMKSVINRVALNLPSGLRIRNHVPLVEGNDLKDGLQQLVESLNGPESKHNVEFTFDRNFKEPTVGIILGREDLVLDPHDILIEADAWTAYINFKENQSNWQTNSPFGPLIAATLASAEIFKYILLKNFPEQMGRNILLLKNTFFSALTLASPPNPLTYPDLQNVRLDHVAIAGLGAGGSSALYALSALPYLYGDLTLIEPGFHKRSNLGRYLLTSYNDCYASTSKILKAESFIHKAHPDLSVRAHQVEYLDVDDREFNILISAVDTPEARWGIQRDWPSYIIDGAVVESIYSLLTVAAGTNGLCLGCKHPYDPNAIWRRRARTWGKSVNEWKRLYFTKSLVIEDDIRNLAEVQSHEIEEYTDLLGVPFDEIPTITECGQNHYHMQEPNQVGTLPFVTTMAGILLAAELVKKIVSPKYSLNNHYSHDLFYRPKQSLIKWRPKKESCHICN